MPEWKHDVFISYNRQDERFVDFLKGCLELAGLHCFRDTTGLEVYDKLDAALKSAIAQSRWLMAVISPAYLRSYWCLFEALESIQGQDMAVRFLPIVVRNSPDDQTLDETFVLDALRELREQMRIFEAQMVAEKAFGLSSKLDKLAFVQNQLPKIFTMINERIYPTFDLWDEASVRSKMHDLLAHLAPHSTIDISAVKLESSPRMSTPLVVPRLSPLPAIVWKTNIGCQAWKNNAVPAGNDILVTSSGRIWNQSDEMDGIYCLHAETGKVRWFFRTPADANHLMVSKGLAVTGCDDGSVVAVRQSDGVQEWAIQLESGIVGGPVRLPANLGSGIASQDRDLREPILVVTHAGNVYILDQVSGDQLQVVDLGSPVIGAPLLVENGRGVIVPTEDGKIMRLEYLDIAASFDGDVKGLTIAGSDLDEDPETASSFVALAAQPCFVNNLIIQGIVRDTYYSAPPLVAVDSRLLKIRWVASPSDMGHFGNLRSPPVIVENEAIFASAYSSKLCAVSLENGSTTWSVDLGQPLFEQWCGPIAIGRSIFIGRHDGYLHKVSSERNRREWSIFLGDNSRSGTVVAGSQQVPEFADSSAWTAGSSSPILATPTIDRGRLYVGTHEGWLYCISNLGNDDADF